jgi:general secretion pathway protein K
MSFKLWADNKGIALIMVLWVLAILIVIALSFTFAVRVDNHSTMSFKEESVKEFLAEAGIERGIMEIFYREANKGQNITLDGMEGWRVDGTPYSIQTDNGSFTVTITDESGKVDINTTPDIILRNLLRNLDIELALIDGIVDSIMDWKDPDELHRLNGAESDYYMTLPKPYRAKNEPFSTLEELLLVKGITQEILYGTKDRKGLLDFITVHSGPRGINVNTAQREVLISIPGITEKIADEIISRRQTMEINYPDWITPAEYVFMEPYISMEESGTFTFVSAGYNTSKKSGYGIKAIVTFTGNNEYEYLYYRKGLNIS